MLKWVLHLFRYVISRLDAQGSICWIARAYLGCFHPEPGIDDIILWAYTERDCSASLSVGVLLCICGHYGKGWGYLCYRPRTLHMLICFESFQLTCGIPLEKIRFRREIIELSLAGCTYPPSTILHRNEGAH